MTNQRDRVRLFARLVFTLVVLAGLSPAATPPASATTSAPITVLLGTSGVTWNDVSVATPNLLNATGWAAGSLAARSVGSFSCPDDGWLAVSAGARARSRPHQDSCAGPPASWAAIRSQADHDPYDADPGLLGQTLSAARIRTVGIGAGARLALARPTGAPVGTWQPRRQQLGTQVRTAVAQLRSVPAPGRLLVVDLGNVTPARRMKDLAAIDTAVGQIVPELPTGSTVMLASLADGGPQTHLQAAALRGPGLPRTLLTSESTRQPGYLVTADVAPTLLEALRVPIPARMTGTPITTATDAAWSGERLMQLRDPDLKAQRMHRVVPGFVLLTYLPVLGLLGWVWWRVRAQATPHWPAALRPFSSFLAMIPAATFLANLVPWWRSEVSLLLAEVTVLVIAGLLSLPLIAGARHLPTHLRPWAFLGWPGLVTVAVMGCDLLTGSRLQIASMIGLQPLLAGRFYGLGNPQFAIFGTGSLLLAGAISGWVLTRRPTPAQDHWSRPQRIAAASTLTVAVLALALDATPGLGSDFGGPPALLPAFLVLTTLILGFPITWRRTLVAAVLTVALSCLICLADWLRPPQQRTHLGRVVQTALDGDLGPVIGRKVGTNLALLVAAPYNLFIPVVTGLLAWYLLRPVPSVLANSYRRAPVLRHLLVAWFVMLTIAFLLNDSGVVVPPVAAVLMLPALLAFAPWPSPAGAPLPPGEPSERSRTAQPS